MSAAEAGVPQYHLAPYVPYTITPTCPTFDLLCFEREIKAGLCYACPSDLWSFGLLILWMLDQSRVRSPRTPQTVPTRVDLIKACARR